MAVASQPRLGRTITPSGLDSRPPQLPRLVAMSDRDLIERYWLAQDPRDFDSLDQCRHPAFEVLWIQTGERIPSTENDRLIHENYVDYPSHEHRGMSGQEDTWWSSRSAAATPLAPASHVSGGGNLWVGEGRLTYGDRSVWYAAVAIDMLDGLVRRETSWFAPMFDPPEWRAQWSKPFEWEASRSVGVVRPVSAGRTAARAQAIERFFETVLDHPGTAHEEFFHTDAIEEIPQSGEQIAGCEDMLAVFLANPNRPRMEVRRTQVIGERGDARVPRI
jgi:hypothetical protein